MVVILLRDIRLKLILQDHETGTGSTASSPSNSTRVLIVDDNLEQSNLMRHGLQFHEMTFDTEIVSTLAEARTYLSRTVPDILVSELTLSDGAATDFLSEDPELAAFPIIVFTDRGSEADAVKCLKAGVLDYVVKTRRKCQEIGDVIRKTLKSWERIRSIRQAEINLQQTLRLARSIMDSLPTPIGVLDKHGTLLSINEAWKETNDELQLFGEAFCQNSNYLECCRSSSQSVASMLANEIEKVIQTQLASYPMNYCTEQKHWYSVTIHPCQSSGRAKAIVVHQDISARKQLEENHTNRAHSIRIIAKLTPRERQVMELVVCGKPNKSIARVLAISVKTVEMHRSNMMKKLKIRSVTDLVRLAVNAGINVIDDSSESVKS